MINKDIKLYQSHKPVISQTSLIYQVNLQFRQRDLAVATAAATAA
jgi:hypothetical protein